MISIGTSSRALAAEPAFRPEDVLRGVPFASTHRGGPGRLCVEASGGPECLRFYGSIGAARMNPVIFLEGDVVQRAGNGAPWSVVGAYAQLSPALLQAEAEQYGAASARTFINLARPGVHGATGHHLQRRREREVALVDRALDRLKAHFGWGRLDLAGLSGGGHLVAALMARRSDIGHAVIASGNVAVRHRLRQRGLDVDVTGYTDFVDPIDLVHAVKLHLPDKVVMLTDPLDRVVTASSQAAYLKVLREAGVEVEQRLVTARDPDHHLLRLPAILAALTNGSNQ